MQVAENSPDFIVGNKINVSSSSKEIKKRFALSWEIMCRTRLGVVYHYDTKKKEISD